jgi:hypothetical protein
MSLTIPRPAGELSPGEVREVAPQPNEPDEWRADYNVRLMWFVRGCTDFGPIKPHVTIAVEVPTSW